MKRVHRCSGHRVAKRLSKNPDLSIDGLNKIIDMTALATMTTNARKYFWQPRLRKRKNNRTARAERAAAALNQ
jgi:hypothetical protein